MSEASSAASERRFIKFLEVRCGCTLFAILFGRQKVLKIMDFMDELDDVQEVHTNAEFPENFEAEE